MDAKAAALSALAQVQVTETRVDQALQRIADIALDAVPAADIVGMTVLGDDGRPTTTTCTDGEPPTIDAAQYREGKGPCLDACRDDTVLHVPRVEDVQDAYPAFAAACRQQGVRSTLSLPMRADGVAVGAMNLYARVPEGFGGDDSAVSQDVAAAGAAVLANVCAYWAAFDLTVQLQEAGDPRRASGRTGGVSLAAQRGASPEDAFGVRREAGR